MCDPTENLLEAIFDNSARDEPWHESDCTACDIASQVAGELAAYWDPDAAWWETSSVGWPELTLIQQAERVVAHVLHRRLHGLVAMPSPIHHLGGRT